MKKTEDFNNLLKGLDGELKSINMSLNKVSSKMPSHLIPNEILKLQQQINTMHQSLKTKENISAIKLPSLNKAPNSSENLVNHQEYRRPVRALMTEQRTRNSILNPQSFIGNMWLKDRFNLPEPKLKNRRSLGTKKYSKPKIIKNYRPKVLPKQYRDDPQADPPPITEQDVSDGIMSLIQRGLIPKDVDLSPAFERGIPPLKMKTAEIHD